VRAWVRIPFAAIFADIPWGWFKLMTLFYKFDMEAFIPREKGCLLNCLDWVPNRGACIDACFVWWRDTLLLVFRYKALSRRYT